MATVRILTADDAGAFQTLRLRGLREAPAAFGSTLEEEIGRSIALVAERLTELRNGAEAGDVRRVR